MKICLSAEMPFQNESIEENRNFHEKIIPHESIPAGASVHAYTKKKIQMYYEVASFTR